MAGSIVVWGGPPYFGPANSTHEEMARAFRLLGYDVLYLELEGEASHFRKEAKISPGPVNGTAISGEGILVARIPKLPLVPYAMVKSIRGVHAGMAAKQLRWLEPIWQDEKATMVLYGWFATEMVSAFGGARIIYDCVDEHRSAEGIEGDAGRVEYVWSEEKRLLASATLTTCVSAQLAEERAPVAKHLVVLPNASDPGWAKGTFTEPESIRDLPRPRALFLGRVGPKVDLELIRAAASADASIGWIVAGEAIGPAPVKMPSNVRVMGRMHHDDLAPIAAHCDCGIAPLRDNAWNRASWPLKYGDYVAAGLPIVTARLPAAEELAKDLGDAVLFAASAEEYVSAVRGAAQLGEDVVGRIRAHAATHTWSSRAAAMLAELQSAGGSR
jgi:glycosyltransferase involved in cell wall biosynthesis